MRDETPQDDTGADPLGDHNASPINRLPGAVWLLLVLVAGVELVLDAAALGLVGGAQGIGWRVEAIQRYAFSAQIQSWMLETRQFPPLHLLRYLSYSFVHGTVMHALFALVMVAALGKAVGERFGALRFLVLALGAPVLAAVLFGAVMGQDTLGWIFGAMPMAFALVGGFTWLLWQEAGADRIKRRRAFSLIGILVAARLLFGLFAETGPQWIAEVAAFGFGFGMSALALGPGSWRRTLARLRGEV